MPRARGWKHVANPEAGGYVRCTDPARLAAIRDAGVPVRAHDVAPRWAVQAPAGTTRSMLRQAKRDPVMRQALIGAARIAQDAGDGNGWTTAVDFGMGDSVTVPGVQFVIDPATHTGRGTPDP